VREKLTPSVKRFSGGGRPAVIEAMAPLLPMTVASSCAAGTPAYISKRIAIKRITIVNTMQLRRKKPAHWAAWHAEASMQQNAVKQGPWQQQSTVSVDVGLEASAAAAAVAAES